MDTRPQHPSPLSRREVLKILGVIGGSSLLAACAPTVATPTAAVPATPVPATKVPATTAPTTVPTQGPVTGKVVVMRHPEEFTDAEMQPLLEQEPGLQIEYVEADATRFFAMYAAGTPPDMLRTQAPAIPQYLARNMLYDLTPYFEVSDLLKPDDLAPANNYYRANSPLEIGEGRIYGMTKDWSPDFTLFAYRKAFEDAGVDLPDDSTPLTYQQVNDLAHNLAKFEGDRVAVWGYGYGDWWSDRIWMNMLGELGKSLYSEDFTQISLSQDEDAKAIMKFYFDLAKENLVASPLNPSPSWNGEDFTKGTVAILQYGYWYSASAESDITKDQVVMLPAPTWAGKRRDPTITATGYIMAAATKVPDATWKVFEWYMGGGPAQARASSGWGVPALISMYEQMPKDTAYQHQVQQVLQGELALKTTPLRFNPYLGETAVADSWAKNLEQGLRGDITFNDLAANIEAEINAAIRDGIDSIG